MLAMPTHMQMTDIRTISNGACFHSPDNKEALMSWIHKMCMQIKTFELQPLQEKVG